MTSNVDPFLTKFISLYNANSDVREGLIVSLMKAVLAKMSGHKNPVFSTKAMNFFIALEATSRKSFDYVSANFLGPGLRAVQRANEKETIPSFIVCEEDSVRFRLLRAINESAADPYNVTMALGFDGTKTPATLSLSTRHKAIIGGAYPDQVISVDGKDEDWVRAKLDPDSDIVRADELKVYIVSFQQPKIGHPVFFALVAQAQTVNMSSSFNDTVTG